MNFRTKISIAPSGRKISHTSRIVTIGSCFADNVAERMEVCGLVVEANPLGEMFNPLSVAATVDRLSCGEPFEAADLHARGDMWFSYDAHGAFDSVDSEGVLQRLNKAVASGHSALAAADWVVLTLGTAWVYEREGKVVANCHKMPQSEFARRRLTVEQVTDSLLGVLDGALAEKNVILTVSPVRHLADGLQGNAVSKATLRLAVEQLTTLRPERVNYFPAYEIVLDDLRDYRFTAADMVHPSQEAVEYVWERFAECYFDDRTLKFCDKVAALKRAVAHRPLHPESQEYAKFKASMLRSATELQKELPECDLSHELEFFGK